MPGGGLGAIGPMMSLFGGLGGGGGGGGTVPAISPQMVANQQMSYLNKMGDLGVAGGSWVPITVGDIGQNAAVQNAQFGLQQQQAQQAAALQNQQDVGNVLGTLFRNQQGDNTTTTTPGLSNTTTQ